jgi:hypothetical protein
MQQNFCAVFGVCVCVGGSYFVRFHPRAVVVCPERSGRRLLAFAVPAAPPARATLLTR